MNCNEVFQKMVAFIDEELPFNEMENMKKHLSLCPLCEGKLQNEFSLKNKLKSIPQKQAGEHLISEVVSYIYRNNAV